MHVVMSLQDVEIIRFNIDNKSWINVIMSMVDALTTRIFLQRNVSYVPTTVWYVTHYYGMPHVYIS